MSEGVNRHEFRQRWRPLSVDEVIVRKRQRKLNSEHVRQLRESFDALGGQLQLQPIVVDSCMVLVDGAHRLQAAKEAGWTHISALVLDGVSDEDRRLLEVEANRVRLQLSPVELEEAWKNVYEPAFRARARRRQAEGGTRGLLTRGVIGAAAHSSSVTGSSSNWISTTGTDPAGRVSLPRAAKEATGLSIETLNKITEIRALSESESVPEELREAARRGLEKLTRPGAPVDAVHRALLLRQERARRAALHPAELRRQELERILDQAVRETTLLAERFAGSWGEELAAAARLGRGAAESLRAVRVALTRALASTVVRECQLDPIPVSRLSRVGGEVTRMLSEQSITGLELEADDVR